MELYSQFIACDNGDCKVAFLLIYCLNCISNKCLQITDASRKRVTIGPGLFRLILALLVVLSHVSRFDIGRPAVFTFFILSGYWVARVWETRYRQEVGPIGFFLSRTLRIWLPFLVAYVLAVSIGLAQRGSSSLAALPGLAVLGVASTGRDALGVSWSLDIELQFYLLVPLLVFFLRGIWGTKFGPLSVVALLLCPPIAGWSLVDRSGIVTVLAYFPSFLLGVILWVSKYSASPLAATISVVIFVSIGVLVWLTPDTQGLLLKEIDTWPHEDWFGMIWTGTLTPFIAWNVSQRESKLGSGLGNYSYSLYLVHQLALNTFFGLAEHNGALPKVTGILVAIAMSALFYLAVDRPAERLRMTALQHYKRVQVT